MSILDEFKTFAMRGNVVDFAVGVIVGAAFTKVTASLVNDIIMPPLGMLLGGIDFNHFAITLKAGSGAIPPVQIKYGVFINTLVDFLIVAAAIFLIVKLMNSLKSETPPSTKDCPECRMSIPLEAKRCGHCCSELHR